MDLLSQYKQDYPEEFQERLKRQSYAEYGFFIRLVMRFSGGRIRDVRQAGYVLLATAVIVLVIALVVFFNGGAGI